MSRICRKGLRILGALNYMLPYFIHHCAMIYICFSHCQIFKKWVFDSDLVCEQSRQSKIISCWIQICLLNKIKRWITKNTHINDYPNFVNHKDELVSDTVTSWVEAIKYTSLLDGFSRFALILCSSATRRSISSRGSVNESDRGVLAYNKKHHVKL